MSSPKISLEELTRFGIAPEDELFHVHSSRPEWWNESFSWDWFDERGERAGHCRFATFPNQDRAWVCLYLYDGAGDGAPEWIALDEPRLPLANVDRDELTFRSAGFELRYQPFDPLRTGSLGFSGRGRALSGPRAGALIDLDLDLEIAGIDAPHSRGVGNVASAESAGVSTNRFVQSTDVHGTIRAGSDPVEFVGFGDRDHAWGPRSWNMEWEFVSLRGPGRRLQAAVRKIPNVGRFATGFVLGDEFTSVSEADFRVEFERGPQSVPTRASLAIKTEDSKLITGHLEPISGVEIDLSHTDSPRERTRFHRTLVRFVEDGVKPRRKRPPTIGWFETNRYLE